MSTISHQVHDNFKSFVGSDIANISTAIASFAQSSGAAAKSIGIVHVNSANELLFSLGYRDDEPGYPVALKSRFLSATLTPSMQAGWMPSMKRLPKAAEGIDGIICHELVVQMQRATLPQYS